MSGYRYDDEGGKHLHSLDGKPLVGCSTAVKVLGKGDGLLVWAVNCAVDHVKNNAVGGGVMDYLVSPVVLEEARTAWKTSRDTAAGKGTERHGVLEKYVERCIKLFDGKPTSAAPGADVAEFDSIRPFMAWASENVDRFLFTETNCYSRKLWTGGVADVGLLMKDGRRLVGDHKSSKAAYFDQFIQAALYDVMLSENGGLTKDGEKRFDWEPADGVVIFPFRSSPFTPEFRYNMDELRKAAEEVVHLHKLNAIHTAPVARRAA